MQCQKLKTYMEPGRVVFLPVRSIRPNPRQPRKVFQPEALDELAESIRRHGILQPLSVRRIGTNYELIAGERRLRAAQLAGVLDVPCILMNMDDRESGMAAMVENLQRQDLDFIEEAWGIQRLLKEWDMSQEQAARLLGKSQSAIANKLRLLKHSQEILLLLRQEGLTERHARALLRLRSDEEKRAAITEIARLGIAMGAKNETFAGLSGIGDLIVTCTSMHSRNRRAGILIGQGVPAAEAVAQIGTVEGYHCAKTAFELSQKLGVEMPIVQQAYQVLYEGKTAACALHDLMERPKRHESEAIWLLSR